MNLPKKLGILAGTFDPVHAGHISFAQHAAKSFGLDQVMFLPERQPRGKAGATNFSVRAKKLKQAIAAHSNLGVLELADTQFTVAKTLPQLQNQFSDSKLVFLFGSDVAKNLPTWDSISELKDHKIIVGLRAGHSQTRLKATLSATGFTQLKFVDSPEPHLSSTQIRQSL